MRRRLGIASLVFVLAALPPVTGQADPLPPDSTVIQRWDLLTAEETATTTKTVALHRGTIGGTSMIPAPTVELEAVGKVAGATGNATWTVELRSATSLLGSVQFVTADSSFTLKPVPPSTAPVTWPATPTDLVSVKLVGSATAPSLLGTFTLRKLSVRLTQSGTIMGTRGSVPLASKQAVDPGSAWENIDTPILYKHLMHGFDPAPEARLRVAVQAIYGYGGINYPAWVRLVDHNGVAVPGSTMSFTYANAGYDVESGPITLSANAEYRLQVREGTPTGWEILNADLLLSQATTDPLGLPSVVGWYPATSLATNLAHNDRTHHMIRPPVNAAELGRLQWIFTAKRTSATGTVQALPAFTDTGGSAPFEMSFSSGSVDITSSGYSLQAATIVDPQIGSPWWDTKGMLINGATGRLAGSMFRASLRLRGTLQGLSASEEAFSPNGDQVKDLTHIVGEIHPDAEDPTWEITIRQGVDPPVHQATGTGNMPEAYWYGTEGNVPSGVVLADGTYTATLSLPGTSAAVRQLIITLDTTPPAIDGFFPEDGGNAFVSTPYVGAHVNNFGAEGGSELDMGATELTLTDLTSGFATPLTTEFDPESGWTRAGPVQLVVGHDYSIQLDTSDLAGNRSVRDMNPLSQGGGFLSSTISHTPGTVSVPRSSCALSDPNVSAGTQRATCENVPVVFSDIDVTLGGSRRSGRGWLIRRGSFQGIMVGTTHAEGSESSQSAYDPSNSDVSDRDGLASFLVQPSSGPSNHVASAPLDGVLSSVVRQVPIAWTNAWLEMPLVSAQTIAPLCNDPWTSVRCMVDPVLLMPGWRSTETGHHMARCDSVLSHRQVTSAQPGQDIAISVGVDTARVSITSVRLDYRINEGPTQSLSQAGTGASSYQFTISGTSLGDEAVVDYMFVASGSFSGDSCSLYTMATAPTREAFHIVASSDGDPSSSRIIREHAGVAMHIALLQPELPTPTGGQTPAGSACSYFFASDQSPCDLFVNSPRQVQEDPDPELPVLGAGEAVNSGGDRTCTRDSYALGGFIWDGDHQEEESTWSEARSEMVPNSALVRFKYLDRAHVHPQGSALAKGSAKIGFLFSYIEGQPSYPMDVYLVWELRGKRIAKALEYPDPCLLFGPWAGAVCSLFVESYADAQATLEQSKIVSAITDMDEAKTYKKVVELSYPRLPIAARDYLILSVPREYYEVITPGVRTSEWEDFTWKRNHLYYVHVRWVSGTHVQAISGAGTAEYDFYSEGTGYVVNTGLFAHRANIVLPEGHYWGKC